MKKYIVVGAGILGASAAYHLAKQGADVTIIDRKDKGQATDAAAGIICPWVSQRRNKAWYTLAKNGAGYYPKLVSELMKEGEKDTGYARVGALCLHKNQEKLKQMQDRALSRKKEAPEMGEICILSPQETTKRFPVLNDQYGAVYVSGAARVNGRALKQALLQAAQNNGAKFINNTAVLAYTENRVTGVLVDEVAIPADIVILCAGAWAESLVEPLGVSSHVTFQKAQIAHLQLEETETSEWPVVMPPSNHYLLSFDGGQIVAGATHENDVNLQDTSVTADGIKEVMDKAITAAPGLADCTFIEMRVGFRPFTPDFLPVIDKLPGWEGLLFANGLGASGLTTGPFLGLQLAKLAMDHEADIDLEPYSIKVK
ncbi:NAD(P)/FAD-dependent oxidoreductase [Fictibacillus iocasae]|uniref:NAD(P)/FAD-dependent oxidoreductase n=1 Tax=Fictibacillus iocasae TaxID=2715437 RepID=A0ABW2NRC3_9BACL